MSPQAIDVSVEPSSEKPPCHSAVPFPPAGIPWGGFPASLFSALHLPSHVAMWLDSQRDRDQWKVWLWNIRAGF